MRARKNPVPLLSLSEVVEPGNMRAKLVGDNPEAADNFGESVSVDRNTVIIGVPRDDDAGRDAGSAYLYFRDGVTWKKQAKLIPTDLGGSDAFGEAVFVPW